MREAILIGLLYAAVGGVMAALAAKYAGPLFLDVVLWGCIALIIGCIASLYFSSQHQATGRPFLLPALTVNLGLCLIAFGLVYHFSNKAAPPATPEASLGRMARLVVSKFIFKPVNSAKIDEGYLIEIHMANHGDIFAYAPLMNYQFITVDSVLSNSEIDEKMKGVIDLSKVPPDDTGRAQIDVNGPDTYSILRPIYPYEEYKLIEQGKKYFYLFMVLNFRDPNLPAGKFWVSEYCAWIAGDFNALNLCGGHNRVWLHQ